MFKWLLKFLLCEYGIFYWTGAATVAGSVVSGALSNSSANASAGNSKKANAQNRADIINQQNTNTQNFAPYTNTGAAANNLLSEYLGIGNGYGGTAATNGFQPLSYEQWAAQQPSNRPVDNGDYGVNRPSFFGSDILAAAGNTSGGAGNTSQANYQNYLNSHPAIAGTNGAAGQHNPAIYGSLLKPFSQNDLNNDVVYNTGLQFGLDQGNSAINRLASANGGIDSGATLKALTRYANDYGTTKAGGAYDRNTAYKNNIYNMLSGQQGVGLNATSALAGQNSGLLGSTVNSNNFATQQVNSANTAGAAGLNNSIQSGIGNYLYNDRLNTGSVVGAPVASGGYSTAPASSTPWYKQ